MHPARTFAVLSALLLASACHAPTEPRSVDSAAAPAPRIDLSDCASSSTTIETFLKRCQQESGLNFTFEAEVAKELRSTPMKLFGSLNIERQELPRFLAAMIDVNGYELAPVGPEHLHVFLVQRKPS
ncbi:MAG: hypothetical protein IPJ77_24710 [Planctomycetes bacterium]|nr:hypothetical protein [Planctomycetota bacterium]